MSAENMTDLPPSDCRDNWNMLNKKFGPPKNCCARGTICSWRLEGGRYILYTSLGDDFEIFRTRQEFDNYWSDRLLEALNDRKALEQFQEITTKGDTTNDEA